jgi:hypothetical protein
MIKRLRSVAFAYRLLFDYFLCWRGDYFRFGSVFIKKITKPKFFFFEKKTETDPKQDQTDQFRFGSVF